VSGVIQQYRLRSGLIHTWLGGSVAEMKMRLLHAGGGPFVIEGLDEDGEWGVIETGNLPSPRLGRIREPRRTCAVCGETGAHPTEVQPGVIGDLHDECLAQLHIDADQLEELLA
jgi:hypothetical protein